MFYFSALNIGISCNLIESDSEVEGRLFVFDSDIAHDRRLVKQALDDALLSIARKRERAKHKSGVNLTFGMAIHGSIWKLMLEDEAIHKLHLKEEASKHEKQKGKGKGKQALSKSTRVVDSSQFDTTCTQNGAAAATAAAGANHPNDSSSHASATETSSVSGGSPSPGLFLLDLFFSLAAECKSVIACRLEPKEKGDIVNHTKARQPHAVLMAIGDGNNDVSQNIEIGEAIEIACTTPGRWAAGMMFADTPLQLQLAFVLSFHVRRLALTGADDQSRSHRRGPVSVDGH